MRMIFVNLPVKDLAAAREFFAGLGFEFNAELSCDACACMIVESNIFVMLLVEERFRDFINGEIGNAAATTEVITSLSADSREHIDETVARAVAAGGQPWKPTFEDGPLYCGSFQDLDGHAWELVYMGPP
jgi:uncharacterized protein